MTSSESSLLPLKWSPYQNPEAYVDIIVSPPLGHITRPSHVTCSAGGGQKSAPSTEEQGEDDQGVFLRQETNYSLPIQY